MRLVRFKVLVEYKAASRFGSPVPGAASIAVFSPGFRGFRAFLMVLWFIFWLRLLPGGIAATSLNLGGVSPGATTRDEAVERFGDPVATVAGDREVFEAPDHGFVRLALSYDEAGLVRRGEFVPVHNFTPEQVELLFDLRSRLARTVDGFDLGIATGPVAAAGFTRHYDVDGLSFYSVGNRVVSLVLTMPAGAGEVALSPESSSDSIPFPGSDGPDPIGADPAGIRLDLPDFTASPGRDAQPARTAAAARAGRIVRLLSVGTQSPVSFHDHPSLLVVAILQAQGLGGEFMTFEVRPVLLDGTPIMAASGTPARHVRPDGSFVLNIDDRVKYDEAVWNPWRAYIVYRWLDLPDGVHDLILHITATCGDASSSSRISKQLVLP